MFVMKSLYKILLCALVLGGCYSDKGYEPKTDYSGKDPMFQASNENRLSTCNERLEGTVIYMNSTGLLMACSGGIWVKTAEVGAYNTSYNYLPEFDADEERKNNALGGNLPAPVYDQYVDTRDGHRYKIVKIDGDWWFAENLDYEVGESEHFEDQYCGDLCGVAYYYDDVKNACPKGFHLSTKSEWEDLIDYVGGEQFAAVALKDDSGVWYGEARNTVGFSALPWDVDYYSENCFWSATDNVLFDISGYEVEMGSNVATQRKCAVRCVGD